MPTASIDESGGYVYYEDSGVPDGIEDYTTVVLVHGYAFNSATFRRLLPHAAAYGLRIFTMNMRDYRGSSTYSADELAAMSSSNTDLHAAAVRRFGRDVARFVTFVCTTQGVPPLVVNGACKRGGVALVTWSLSNMALLAILGDPATLDAKSAAVLQRYLRKMVLYDCANVLLGEYPDIGLSWPLVSTEVPAEQKPAAFAQWISSYFKPMPDVKAITPDTMRACAVLPERPPTVATLTADEFAATFEPSISGRSGLILRCSGLAGILQRNARRAFLDADAVLPGVDAVALWCDQSVWICVWGTKALQDLLAEEPVPSKRKRRVGLQKIEGANHFIHWDEPERFIRVLKEAI